MTDEHDNSLFQVAAPDEKNDCFRCPDVKPLGQLVETKVQERRDSTNRKQPRKPLTEKR